MESLLANELKKFNLKNYCIIREENDIRLIKKCDDQACYIPIEGGDKPWIKKVWRLDERFVREINAAQSKAIILKTTCSMTLS